MRRVGYSMRLPFLGRPMGALRGGHTHAQPVDDYQNRDGIASAIANSTHAAFDTLLTDGARRIGARLLLVYRQFSGAAMATEVMENCPRGPDPLPDPITRLARHRAIEPCPCDWYRSSCDPYTRCTCHRFEAWPSDPCPDASVPVLTKKVTRKVLDRAARVSDLRSKEERRRLIRGAQSDLQEWLPWFGAVPLAVCAQFDVGDHRTDFESDWYNVSHKCIGGVDLARAEGRAALYDMSVMRDFFVTSAMNRGLSLYRDDAVDHVSKALLDVKNGSMRYRALGKMRYETESVSAVPAENQADLLHGSLLDRGNADGACPLGIKSDLCR